MLVPPIKSQGIKTKLVPLIKRLSDEAGCERWVEPFMGTGCVAFNIQPEKALLCDINPHIVNFYKSVQNNAVTGGIAREFLTEEGAKLLASDGAYYYEVRDRFNRNSEPLDFLFLSRACFNGMMRFNKKGGFNVPFCRKPNRFMQALVTKITNQVSAVCKIIARGEYEFRCQDFRETLLSARQGDMIYCDPPYIGRNADYFDSWSEEADTALYNSLAEIKGKFILSTWLKNRFRENERVFSVWKDCYLSTYEHFYHVGGYEENRNSMTEAVLTNFPADGASKVSEFVYTESAPAPAAGGQAPLLL